jgi:hypothetical protein
MLKLCLLSRIKFCKTTGILQHCAYKNQENMPVYSSLTPGVEYQLHEGVDIKGTSTPL